MLIFIVVETTDFNEDLKTIKGSDFKGRLPLLVYVVNISSNSDLC